MKKAEDFQKELDQIFDFAEKKKLDSATINAGDFHQVVGDHPGSNHRILVCCSVLRKAMISADQILVSPPKGNGQVFKFGLCFPERENKRGRI